MKVLTVEDNRELAGNIRDYLVGEGYVCERAETCKEAEEKLGIFEYDCIILDLMLPDGDGLRLLELIRSKKLQSSILIVSAKGGLDDKVKGLDLGADDYITKPFYLPELNARIKAIYRRKNLDSNNNILFNEITVDLDTNQVKVSDASLELTKKEFDLLLYFLANKNRVLTRQTIAEHLWGDYTDSLANFDFVYQHVKNLRKKITQANGTDYIKTVYGLGYKFDTSRQ